jgi:hypothetical protein
MQYRSPDMAFFWGFQELILNKPISNLNPDIMKKFLTIIAALCLPAIIMAQNTGEIKGKILDAKTNEALPGTSVYVKHMGSIIATSAGSDGTFTLKPLDPGTYNVYITMITYDTIVFQNVSVIADKPTFVDDVAMTSEGHTFPTFVFTDVKPIDKGLGPLINIPKDILDQLPSSNEISDILRCTMADVYVSDDGDEIYFRGSRDGDAIYIVDGVKMRDNELHIPGGAIGSVSVYTGGVPANYGDFTGGVVVIETQSYFSWLNQKKAKEEARLLF